MKKPPGDFIPLPSKASTSLLSLVSQEEFKQHKHILNWTFGFIVAVLAICVTSFILLVIDAWRFRSAALSQNTEIIEKLKSENLELKMQALAARINELEKRIEQKEK